MPDGAVGDVGFDDPGFELAEVECTLPAILVSGDTSAASVESSSGVDDSHLLSKPVDADQPLELSVCLLQAPGRGASTRAPGRLTNGSGRTGDRRPPGYDSQ